MRTSILVLSSDSVYPDAIGGMEIRGRDVVDALSTIASVTVMSASSCKVPRPPETSQPSVIYLNKISGFSPMVLQELLALGTPVVAWFGDRHQGRFLDPVVDEDARRRIFSVFNCDFLRKHHAAHGGAEGRRRDDERQAVIYEGVDTKMFAPRAGQHTKPRFVFLGRATREKGFLDFCKVMAALPDALVESIDIIGDGPALAGGLSILEKSGRDRVLLAAGACPREDVPARLQSGSILLLPSYDEGLPGAVIEAMASGLCVVASAVGGVPEIVLDGDTGLTHAAGDLDGLLAQTRRVAESRQLRQRLARRGRALVKRQHGRSRWLKQTLAVVRSHGAIKPKSRPRKKSQLIIITPCSRPQDLAKVSRSITFPCTWIVVFDATEPRADIRSPAADVIVLASAGGVAGKHQINTALEYCRDRDVHGFVYVLDDDNLMHEEFYQRMSKAIKSGKKGYIVQQEVSPGRIRPVSPETTKTGYIDQAQFVVHTDLMRHASYRQHYDADGMMIESLFEQHADEFEFVHETLSYYNRLRWDTTASEPSTPSSNP